MFVSGKLLQPSLKFVGEGAYLSEAPLRLPYSKLLEWTGEACQGQKLYLITKAGKLPTNSFITLVPGVNVSIFFLLGTNPVANKLEGLSPQYFSDQLACK